VPLFTSDPAFGRDWLAERLSREQVRQIVPELPRFVFPADRTPVPAAVLVPVVNHPQGPTVMFTQRTAHLYDHAGQVSFPGGRVDDIDADREATALRETEEETGLHRSRVDIIGRLPDYDIMTGFRVTPIVGWVEPPYNLQPDPFEVEKVFEVPLEFLLDPENHQEHSREVNGIIRHYYAMPYGDHNIWGATAGMVHMLYRALVEED
jgi:8-oxo-dGTP pyrophosphatase MutT (NUDIX family)